jgi:DnaJ family protein C protein 28
MKLIDHIAEEKIKAAQEAGEFDDLRGKGQPLKLDQDPLADPAWQLAGHLLKEQGFSLPWIEIRKEIESELEIGRERLQQAWSRRLSSQQDGITVTQIDVDWHSALKTFSQMIKALNRRIAAYNLQVPSSQFQRPPLTLAHELLLLKPGTSLHPDDNPAV